MAKSEQRESGHVHPPEKFSFVPEEWKKYKQRFERYITITNRGLNDAEKMDCLIYCMGERAEDILIQFGENLTYASLLENFDDFFSPKKNVIYERFKFNQRNQKEGEKFDIFLTEIHKLAEHCEYGKLKEDLIRDRIVVGLRDKKTSERLLLRNELTLKEAILMCKQAEVQQEESKVINQSPTLYLLL